MCEVEEAPVTGQFQFPNLQTGQSAPKSHVRKKWGVGILQDNTATQILESQRRTEELGHPTSLKKLWEMADLVWFLLAMSSGLLSF